MDDRRYQNNRVHHHVLSAWKTTKVSTLGRFIAYLLLGGEKWEFAINSGVQFHFPYREIRQSPVTHCITGFNEFYTVWRHADAVWSERGQCSIRSSESALCSARFVCVCERVSIRHTDWIRSHAAIFICTFSIYIIPITLCMQLGVYRELRLITWGRAAKWILRLYYTF